MQINNFIRNTLKETDPSDGFSRWSSQQFSHKVQLVDYILSGKQRFPSKQFSKDTPNAPNIYRWCVL